MPFVSAVDLAQAAFEALTREKSFNKDFFVLGPELHSYDEVLAAQVSVMIHGVAD